MSSEISQREYWEEVNALAETIVSDCASEVDYPEDADGDALAEAIHERTWVTVDSHQWVIYTAFNFEVLRHSPSDSYAIENWGAESAVRDGTIHWAGLAFGALYADVSERIAETYDLEELAERIRTDTGREGSRDTGDGHVIKWWVVDDGTLDHVRGFECSCGASGEHRFSDAPTASEVVEACDELHQEDGA